ncbi:MAG: DUF58 domain-containing protein, partial [Bdellovibrionota bacterium]
MWSKFLKGRRAKEQPETETEEIRAAGRAPMGDIAKRVKEVELITRRKSAAMLAGEYKSRFKGQGMQFADSRVYQYGDDIRHIDWRTTARMQEAYVKTFEEERELNIVFAVDVSASGGFGSTGLSKRENLAVGLACLGFSAISNNDRVGLILFSDTVERFVPARKGRKHILRIIDELLTYEPQSKKSNLDPALNFLSSMLKHGSVILFASDFFASFDKKKLQVLSRKHDFICMRATDPRDQELPNVGLLRIEDPETGENVLLSTQSAAIRKAYGDSQRKLNAQITDTVKKAGASMVDIATHVDPVQALRAFFHPR